jgi:hypothetical protein
VVRSIGCSESSLFAQDIRESHDYGLPSVQKPWAVGEHSCLTIASAVLDDTAFSALRRCKVIRFVRFCHVLFVSAQSTSPGASCGRSERGCCHGRARNLTHVHPRMQCRFKVYLPAPRSLWGWKLSRWLMTPGDLGCHGHNQNECFFVFWDIVCLKGKQ